MAITASSAFAVRRFASDDPVEPLVALVHTAFGALQIDPPSSALRETAADFAVRARSQCIFVAMAEGDTVGAIFCEPQSDDFYVGRLAVAEGWRRRGVATALMCSAIDEARACRARRVTLRVRIMLPDNVAFFSRLGFAIVGSSAHPGYAHPTSYEMVLML